MKSYKDLAAWQRSLDLAIDIYRITETFPRQELYGLTAQMRAAAVSVPSNIAEGQGRMTTGEQLQFLGHSRGSLYELETQAIIAGHLGFIDSTQIVGLESKLSKTGATLAGYIRYVKSEKGKRS